MGAQYSIPYAVAVTLFHGRPGVQEFSAETIRDPKLQRLLRKCKIVRREKIFRDGEADSKVY